MENQEEYEIKPVNNFQTDKYYKYVLATRTKPLKNYPYIKYYTTNPTIYLGKYVRSVRWGGMCGDGRGGSEIFMNDNNNEIEIEYHYEGITIFMEA